ncbi:MAG: hypothetical protein EA379_02065 [Phycisphaerales bacterium]|nr:MAG: hypothetical protein EA379_02065 [Phycisphaerales bacterium]
MSNRRDKHVLLMTYADEPEANLLAARLREAGIGAEVVGGVSATTMGPYAGHNSPVRVMVLAEQHEAALRLLDEIRSQGVIEYAADEMQEADTYAARKSAMEMSAAYGRYAVIGILTLSVFMLSFGIYQYLASQFRPPRYNDEPEVWVFIAISTIAFAVIVVGVVGFCRLVFRLLRG